MKLLRPVPVVSCTVALLPILVRGRFVSLWQPSQETAFEGQWVGAAVQELLPPVQLLSSQR